MGVVGGDPGMGVDVYGCAHEHGRGRKKEKKIVVIPTSSVCIEAPASIPSTGSTQHAASETRSYPLLASD